MGIFKKKLDMEKARSDSGSSRLFPGGDVGSTPRARLSPSQLYNVYAYNEWIRAIIDKIQRRVTMADIKLRKLDGKKSSKSEIRIKIIKTLISNPNRLDESFLDIKTKYVRDLLIYDAAAIYIVKNQKGVPSELFNIPAYNLKVLIDPATGLPDIKNYAYELTTSSGPIKFRYDEIIYDNLYAQTGTFNPMPPIETLTAAAGAEALASNYNSSFFANSARPSFALLFENASNQDLKRFATFWDQELKGKPHRPIIAGIKGGKATYYNTSVSNKDMEFNKYTHWLLSKMMAVYGMQPLVMGLTDSSTGKLNSEQQNVQFINDAVLPILNKLIYSLNTKLINLAFGFDDIEFYYDITPILSMDSIEQKAKIDNTYVKAGLRTINELRARDGLPPVKWGDTMLVNSAMVSVESQLDTSTEDLSDPLNTTGSSDDDNYSDNPDKAYSEYMSRISKIKDILSYE